VKVDVLVVGAGPAGSSTAIHLARGGARVLLVDKARFPRDKPCGGGLTGRALKRIPVDPSPVVERDVDRFELRLRYGSTFARSHSEPLIRMTQRRRLDAFLAEHAVAAGADFRDGTKVELTELGTSGVTARVGAEVVQAGAVIGADGANGVVARASGVGEEIVRGVALEGNVPLERLHGDLERTAGIELAVVPGGYGWVFPKGDHANFGVGGWEEEGPRLRDHLRRLCDAHGASFDDLEELRGYRLPLREPGSTMARGRALLVGDAAGLIDPVSGDGMFEGFLSSQYASEAVLDLLEGRRESLDPYGPRLAKRLANHLWASWGVKVALDRYPRATFGLASTKLVWGAVERLVRGEVADVGGIKGLARPPLKAIALLARAAGDPGRAYKHV